MDSIDVVCTTRERLSTGNIIDCNWVLSRDPYQLALLEEEKANAGLSGVDIILLVPHSKVHVNPEHHGVYGKLDSGERFVGINTSRRPNRFYYHAISERELIRHVVAHTKFDKYNVPEFLRNIYKWVIELRVGWYERKFR